MRERDVATGPVGMGHVQHIDRVLGELGDVTLEPTFARLRTRGMHEVDGVVLGAPTAQQLEGRVAQPELRVRTVTSGDLDGGREGGGILHVD